MVTLLFGLFFGVEERLHSAVVETVGLHEVDDHELILHIFAGVGH